MKRKSEIPMKTPIENQIDITKIKIHQGEEVDEKMTVVEEAVHMQTTAEVVIAETVTTETDIPQEIIKIVIEAIKIETTEVATVGAVQTKVEGITDSPTTTTEAVVEAEVVEDDKMKIANL